MSKRAAIDHGYRILGLASGADFDAVKSAFRKRVKDVHPDTGQTTPQALAALADLLKAYELLKVHAPRCIEYAITPEEARKGGLRTIEMGDRTAMIRVPKDARTGIVLAPIGDAHWRVRIVVRDIMVDDAPQSEASADEATRSRRLAEEEAATYGGILRGFLERFVKASPAARMAKWARRGRTA
ncbi:MAG: J domain-containing protein [Pseudomonadota bacterium]